MMKPVLSVMTACLLLAAASTTALAYSGSECEVNDCSKPGPGKASPSANQGQPKTKAALKAEAKEEAKTQSKAKLMEKSPSPLREVSGFFK
jgi:hypothetical protein